MSSVISGDTMLISHKKGGKVLQRTQVLIILILYINMNISLVARLPCKDDAESYQKKTMNHQEIMTIPSLCRCSLLGPFEYHTLADGICT